MAHVHVVYAHPGRWPALVGAAVAGSLVSALVWRALDFDAGHV